MAGVSDDHQATSVCGHWLVSFPTSFVFLRVYVRFVDFFCVMISSFVFLVNAFEVDWYFANYTVNHHLMII